MNAVAEAAIKQGHHHFFADPPNLDAAVREFQRAAELAPEWSEGFGWLAAALQRRGDLSQALDAATRAVELSDQDTRHLISLGRILLDLQRFDDAVRMLRRGLELHPHYAEADARLFLADALDRSGQLDAAREQWRIISAMEPSYPSYEKAIEEARRKLTEAG